VNVGVCCFVVAGVPLETGNAFHMQLNLAIAIAAADKFFLEDTWFREKM